MLLALVESYVEQLELHLVSLVVGRHDLTPQGLLTTTKLCSVSSLVASYQPRNNDSIGTSSGRKPDGIA